MYKDDDMTEFSGILGKYPTPQPGGILAGLFPAELALDPQQRGGMALVPAANAMPVAAGIAPLDLPHMLRMIDYKAAMLRAAGRRPASTGTANADGSAQGAPTAPAPVAAPAEVPPGLAPAAPPTAQAAAAAPGKFTATIPLGSVPLPSPNLEVLQWLGAKELAKHVAGR